MINERTSRHHEEPEEEEVNTKLFEEAKVPGFIEDMTPEQEKLVGAVLDREESLIRSHKKLINGMIELMGHQIDIVGEVSRPGSSIEDYLDKLESIMETKEGMILKIKDQAANLRVQLEEVTQKRQSLELIEEEWLI